MYIFYVFFSIIDCFFYCFYRVMLDHVHVLSLVQISSRLSLSYWHTKPHIDARSAQAKTDYKELN